MLEQEFTRLKALGKLQPDGGLDRPGAGETDEGLGLGEDEVSQGGKARRDATHRGVGQDGNEQAAGLVVSGQGGRDLGHLHEGENAFMHASPAAGAANNDEGQGFVRGSFDEADQALADDAAHAPHDEAAVGDSEGHAAGPNHAAAGEGGIGQAGPFLLGGDAVLIAFGGIHELQGVRGAELRVPFLKGPFIQDVPDPFLGGHIEVVFALRANVEQLFRLFPINRRRAAGAALPEPFGNPALGSFAHRFGPGRHGLWRERGETGTA